MGIPQIILIVYFSMTLLLSARENGKPKKGKTDFGVSLVASALLFGVLIWGGFFK